MTLEAQDLEFTDLTYGRITVGGREHATARYVAWTRVHSKKYLLAFGGRGYALTAESPNATWALEREGVWDAIASSFRLLPWAAAEAARLSASAGQSVLISWLREQLEGRLERRAQAGVLYGRGYDAVAEGDYGAARKLLERCLAEQPDHGLAHKELAVVYEKLGYPRRALQHRRAVQRLDPADAINGSKLDALQRDLSAHPWLDFLAALVYLGLLDGLLWMVAPWRNMFIGVVAVVLALLLTAKVVKHGPRVGLPPWAARLLGVALVAGTVVVLFARAWWK